MQWIWYVNCKNMYPFLTEVDSYNKITSLFLCRATFLSEMMKFLATNIIIFVYYYFILIDQKKFVFTTNQLKNFLRTVDTLPYTVFCSMTIFLLVNETGIEATN